MTFPHLLHHWLFCFLLLLSSRQLHAQLATAPPQWQVSSSTPPVNLGHGAFKVTKNISGPRKLELHLVFFDSKHCSIEVLDQPSFAQAINLPTLITQHGHVIAACNGGYFTPEFAPLGLVISNSKPIGKFERSSLLGGFIQVKKDRPMLLWRDEFANESHVSHLLQAGPRLVTGGYPVKGLEGDTPRPRTFIFTDNNGKWAIGICYSATLRQLSDLLASSKIITEMQIDRALNLDGGRSTSLWWNVTDGKPGYYPSFRLVRNFLLIVPRKKS